jgi:Spy/CpxP family protein refolding chaperone
MKRAWERPLLLFSLALNVGFVSLAAVRLASNAPSRQQSTRQQEWRRAPFAERWQMRRIEMLSRMLDLSLEQQQRLTEELRDLEPQLREARQGLEDKRIDFERALRGGGSNAVRDAADAVSRAQAELDRLSAEAMRREMGVFTPAQRDAYLGWTFRPGPRHGMGRGMRQGMGMGPPPQGPPPDEAR